MPPAKLNLSHSRCFLSRYIFLTMSFLVLGQTDAEKMLKFVVLVFRHGDISPTMTYPKDIYQEDSWPDGFGQLTELGIQQHYELGKYLRKRYSGFLNETYSRHEGLIHYELVTGVYIIEELFSKGCTQVEILKILKTVHKISLSQRHLRRILHKLGLKRRGDDRPISAIFNAVKVELQHWSPAKGIRAMHRRIRDERKLQPCYRNDVNQAMKELDATGLRLRTPGKCKIERKNYFSKGPNDTWHIDGNDKLKFYGIWVHLGIDGYSRHIIWLQAGTSNRKPEFIARYYLDAVTRENGCPRLVRADRGKENQLVALLQTSFRNRHCDSLAGIHSFRYGKSVHNQRMVGSGILDISNPIHIHCLQFSFLKLIQNELKLESAEWNNHKIRKQRGVAGPFGKPEILYHSPPEGTINQLQSVDQDLLDYATSYCCDTNVPLEVGNKSFRLLCTKQLYGTTFEDRSSVQNATSSYMHLASYFMNKVQILKADIPKNFKEATSIYVDIEQNLRD